MRPGRIVSLGEMEQLRLNLALSHVVMEMG